MLDNTARHGLDWQPMRLILGFLLLLAVPAGAATVTINIPYVTRPSGPLLLDASIPDGAGPFPGVLIVHGGGFFRGNKVTFVPPIFQPLTNAGMAWFTIDYRMGDGVTIQDQLADVQAALNWIDQHAATYHLDRAKIALLGESAGAFLVDEVLMQNQGPAKIAAVVSFYTPADLSFPPPSGTRAMPPASQSLFGTTGLSESATLQHLKDISPYSHVRKGLPPILLLHGTADEQVSYEQSPRFCSALKAAGDSCELFVVPNGRHGMGAWEEHTEQTVYKSKVVEWLKQTLH
jgi:acetyl esterase